LHRMARMEAACKQWLKSKQVSYFVLLQAPFHKVYLRSSCPFDARKSSMHSNPNCLFYPIFKVLCNDLFFVLLIWSYTPIPPRVQIMMLPCSPNTHTPVQQPTNHTSLLVCGAVGPFADAFLEVLCLFSIISGDSSRLLNELIVLNAVDSPSVVYTLWL
jgi:hypothetical protein